MRQPIFTLLILSAITLFSCRKDSNQVSIQLYDDQQIQNYIAAHSLTGMVKDTNPLDSSGMYYQLLTPGTGAPVDYSDKIYFVFTLRSFDGKYISSDTIQNHYYDYIGHINKAALPLGLQMAIRNILKNPGASMRLLIPSHLAYGRNGYGSGSNTIANNKIPGNACLDYYVHSIDLSDPKYIAAYDDQVIQSYLKAQSLTGYSKTASGLYYKVLTPGTNPGDPITDASTITTTYTGQLLNLVIFDGSHNGTNSAIFNISDFATPGNVEGLENYANAGAKLSLIMPSSLGYGNVSQTGIPAFSCLRFTWVVSAVTP